MEEVSALIERAQQRGLMEIAGNEVTYHLKRMKRYRFDHPEERVRAETIAFLVLEKGYDQARIDTEIVGSHNDFADVVLFSDARCKSPYLVVENKKAGCSKSEFEEAVGQAFANAIALGAKYSLVDTSDKSQLYAVEGFPALERVENNMGDRGSLPANYEHALAFRYVAGADGHDIAPASSREIELAVKRVHAVIWAGGKRDPLAAFDEWSKLMLAKVYDERYAQNGEARAFQRGVGETDSSVSTRVHELFESAQRETTDLFPEGETLRLSDAKVAQSVDLLEGISFVGTDADTIGTAFESFYGSVFRGQLGQYFTMRPVARFVVAALKPSHSDSVLDPTCGSGSFLLEDLLQVWRSMDDAYGGRGDLAVLKSRYAQRHVYGIEIHEVLARICKISLLLHHDGHTNIVADESCLSPHLPPQFMTNDSFDIVVGNPPFGTKVKEGDLDQLDGRSLSEFAISEGKNKVQSEHIILEHSVRLLRPGGRLGMVLPDGVLNNGGEQSNCPEMRDWLFRHGRILGVVSLPDFAFRHSGATNKTSVLLFQKFTEDEFDKLNEWFASNADSPDIARALRETSLDYEMFFAEAEYVGYTPSGQHDARNDLYMANDDGSVSAKQEGSILGEWRKFCGCIPVDDGRCAVLSASDVWNRHESHRIDPKYHVYKSHAEDCIPEAWHVAKLGSIVRRRLEVPDFEQEPLKEYRVLTLSQSGDIRLRQAGVGNNPPEWLGMYFADSSSTWHVVHVGDIVYSGIDLWKGVVCYVTPEYDGALVTNEYPVLEVVDDDDVSPEFLAYLLRTERFQKAFRAINTGHSNRRRTQKDDFNEIDVYYPPIEDQKRIAGIIAREKRDPRVANCADRYVAMNRGYAVMTCDIGIPAVPI